MTIFLGMLLFPALAQAPAGPAPQPPVSEPLRAVQGQAVVSPHSPAARIEIAKPFRYIGGRRFILYGVAEAEQHFFVDTDEQKRLRRLYWIQFEAYLPDNTHQYNYKSPLLVTIDGLSFFADSLARSTTSARPRAGSDGEHARAHLESKGIHLPQDVLWQRLVHLTDDTKRTELMIIYSEDLAPTGWTAADFAPQGRAADKWPDVAKGLLERAKAGVKIIK